MAATDERAIHEFPTGTIDDNSLLIMDRPTSTPGEYETEKFAIANLGLKLLGGIDFPSNLDTDEQDIFGAINEVNAKAMNIAAEYDETASYSKGSYCIYQNAAYCCIKASGTTTGTFVAADWTQIKVLSEVKSNTSAINELESGKSNFVRVGWGTSIETILSNHSHYLVLINSSQVYLVWIAGETDINLLRFTDMQTFNSNTGTWTDPLTNRVFIRSGSSSSHKLTVTTPSEASLTIIG